MSLPPVFAGKLRLPVIGAPLFIISTPDLVIAQCTSGVTGAFPTLNARPVSQLDEWLHRITEELAVWDRAHPERPSAPYAANLIVNKNNARLEEDLALCMKWKVPVIITSLGAREDVNHAIHSYGGITLHDIIHNRFAHKAIDKGADGLIAVAAGAGGHAGTISPFALVQEIREWFSGPLALSGCIATGRSVLAAIAMGADLAYIGSAFIATKEARAVDDYKQMLIDCGAEDIVYTDLFTGVKGNYLKPSVARAGLNPDNLPTDQPGKMHLGTRAREEGAREEGNGEKRAWRDVWGAGQGIGAIKDVVPVADLVDRLEREYQAARAAI